MFNPNNPIFVLVIIAVFALLWANPPKTVFWKTKWWERHINKVLDPNDPRMD